jgi:hypothetical protein
VLFVFSCKTLWDPTKHVSGDEPFPFLNWRAAGLGLLLVLGALPAYFLLADIRRFAVNVPFMDDWQFIPLVEKARDGTLKFEDWKRYEER